jgi:hypothetical protein
VHEEKEAGTEESDHVIREEAWLFCRKSSGVRLCWEFKEHKRPKGPKPPTTNHRLWLKC